MRSLKSPQKVPGASEANFSRIYAREVGASARENSWLRPPPPEEWGVEALSGLGSREETTRESTPEPSRAEPLVLTPAPVPAA